jgi:hypothetical protein
MEHAMGDASHGLAGAVGEVVSCATAAQVSRVVYACGDRTRHLQDALRAAGAANAFKRDPTWAKGLITSANELSASVDEMCVG